MNFNWETERTSQGDQLTVLRVFFEPDEEPLDRAMITQMGVFMKAMEVYQKRNQLYKDNWKRMGWRGMLVRIKERQERLWDAFWNGDEQTITVNGIDDAIDLINFVGFFCRAVDEGNRDGSWWEGV